MINRHRDYTTVTIDHASAFALEQMATTEGRNISSVLRAAITARWHAHREAERRHRESAMDDHSEKAGHRHPGIVELEDFRGESRGDQKTSIEPGDQPEPEEGRWVRGP